jgi:hypothetical protein
MDKKTNRNLRTIVLLATVASVFAAAPVAAGELEDRIASLEQEVVELRELLASAGVAGTYPERFDEIERRIEILAAELEKLRIGEAATASDDDVPPGLGPAASKIYRTERGVSIGGYGEMLYENYDSEREDGAPSDKSDELDFLRAVLYFGYKFDDRFLLNTEIEWEHASTSEEGDVSVEFAYVDYLWRDEVNIRAGMVLLPMGFLNELHEPTVFLGTERPETERRIIPSTWRENGVGVFGNLGPVTYRSYVVNGLGAEGFEASGLRGGRQKGSKAKAEDFAWVGRVDYVGTPGLTAGLSAYCGNSGQDLEDVMGKGLDVKTSIVEGHAEWRWRGVRLRALGAWAEVDDVAELNDALGLAGNESVGEKMIGAYVEAGYDVLAKRGKSASLTPYARWERIDTQEEVPAGFMKDRAQEGSILTVGFAYQPIGQLIVKADFQDRDNEADTGVDQFNVALGYIF